MNICKPIYFGGKDNHSRVCLSEIRSCLALNFQMRAHFKWSWLLLLAYALLLACGSVFVSAHGPRMSTSKLEVSVVSQENGKLSFLALNPGSCLTDNMRQNRFTLVAGGCEFKVEWTNSLFLFDLMNHEHDGSNVPVYVSNKKLKVGYADRLPAEMQCGVKFKPNNNTNQGGYVVDFDIEDIVKTCSEIVIEFGDRYELYVPPHPSTPEDEKKMRDTTLVIVFSVLGSLLLIIALGFSLYYCWWKKRGLKQGDPEPTQVVVPAQKPKPSQINITPNVPEIKAISKNHVKATQPEPKPCQLPAPVPAPVPVAVSAPAPAPVPAPVRVPTPIPTPVPEPSTVLAPGQVSDQVPVIDENQECKLKSIDVSRVPTPIIIRGARTKASEEMSEKLYGGLNDFSETKLVPNTIEMDAFDRKLDRSRRNAKAVDEDEQKQKKHWSKGETALNTNDMEAIDRQREISRRNAKAVDEGEQKRKRKKHRNKK